MLCADVSGILENTLYYEVDSKWKDYLTVERADAFLIALLPYALSHSANHDILELIFEAPISEQLYYQLSEHYIPTLLTAFSWCHAIKITAPFDHSDLCQTPAIATGISSGVDSFYTLLKSLEHDSAHYKVTHGLYFETEALKNNMPLEDAIRNLAMNTCRESDIEYVRVKSNLCPQVYSMVHELIVSNLFMSYALALQKLINVFYFSSSHTYTSFKFEEYSSEYHQLFNVHCFTVEGLNFYTTGSDAIRHEKTSYIADFNLPRKHFLVCRDPYV